MIYSLVLYGTIDLPVYHTIIMQIYAYVYITCSSLVGFLIFNILSLAGYVLHLQVQKLLCI